MPRKQASRPKGCPCPPRHASLAPPWPPWHVTLCSSCLVLVPCAVRRAPCAPRETHRSLVVPQSQTICSGGAARTVRAEGHERNTSSHSINKRCACACAFRWDFADFWPPRRIVPYRRLQGRGRARSRCTAAAAPLQTAQLPSPKRRLHHAQRAYGARHSLTVRREIAS